MLARECGRLREPDVPLSRSHSDHSNTTADDELTHTPLFRNKLQICKVTDNHMETFMIHLEI